MFDMTKVAQLLMGVQPYLFLLFLDLKPEFTYIRSKVLYYFIKYEKCGKTT